ncbi:MAG: glycosyltransferase [Deltaproteobacteria bacterium]|nr:glycosyltransferase [Deltaproteobacteria bacterium]
MLHVVKKNSPVKNEWPKITLVTPVFNAAHRIELTIQSVLSQDYPNLEYIIIDGGSTDGTVTKIKKYESQLSFWKSEKDTGLYDALNKGFYRSTGEIMGWIGAGDHLHVGSLKVVGSCFKHFSDVEWITGIPTGFDEQGMCTFLKETPRWSRFRFLAGANRHIQQESTFFRRSLWQKSGAYVNAQRKSGADFDLWLRFFRHAPLYRVHALIAGYTWHADAGSVLRQRDDDNYQASLVRSEWKRVWYGWPLRAIDFVNRVINKIPKVRALWYLAVTRWISFLLYNLPGPDTPRLLRHDCDKGWHYGPR